MKRFVVPPNWPVTPRRHWIPPKSWRPDPSWPPAPPGWRFWVNGRGKPVHGPIGRYGAPTRRTVYAGAAALIVFAAVNIWAVLAIGVFNSRPDDSAAVTFASSTPSSSVSSASPSFRRTTARATNPVVRRTTTPPPVSRSIAVPRKTHRTTQPPAQRRTSERPAPTRTRATARPRAPRPTATPSTQQELFQQYCLQQGIDPVWCNPSAWQRHP